MLSVLVIDDDVGLARALRRMLRSMYDVELETSGFAGIARIIETGRSSARFDVVLCDSRMPGVSGAEVLQVVRAHSPTTVFIAMSGEDVLEGADGNLSKPFSQRDVAAVIASVHHQIVGEKLDAALA